MFVSNVRHILQHTLNNRPAVTAMEVYVYIVNAYQLVDLCNYSTLTQFSTSVPGAT